MPTHAASNQAMVYDNETFSFGIRPALDSLYGLFPGMLGVDSLPLPAFSDI